MVPAHSYGIPRAPYYSGYFLVTSVFVYRTFTFYGMLFLNISTNLNESFIAVRTPDGLLLLVWALSLSLATTQGIDFSFFSYGY